MGIAILKGTQGAEDGLEEDTSDWPPLAGRRRRARRGRRARWAAAYGTMLALLLLATILSAVNADASRAQASDGRARLDRELARARGELGIPDALLAPVVAREGRLAPGRGGLFYNYADAAAGYDRLARDLRRIERDAPRVLRQRAQSDLAALASILNQRRGEGFAEAPTYQARLSDAQRALADARTSAEFAHVSDLATAQTQALQALWPAYQKLQALHAVIKALRDAGIGTQRAQALYDQDLRLFREAASADRYQALAGVIDAQVIQLQADAATARPYVAKALLDQFQARIDLLRQFLPPGDATADRYQKQRDDDAARLGAARQLADYAALAGTITGQDNAMASPLIRAKARYDYTQLDTLVHLPSVTGRMMVNKSGFDGGKSYPIAYEYLDPSNGAGDVAGMLARARTDADYQAADFRATSLAANLRALLDNYDPATDEVDMRDDAARINAAHERPHPADLQLMRYYNVAAGKVIVISLREQVARFYEGGHMDAFTYVTTGRPGDTSIPGFWTAINRHAPDNPNRRSAVPIPGGFGDVFTAPDPAGTPGYYQPTPIHYDVAYNPNGFWLHDAYWRGKFGPETNLPHHDPMAFNGGSHGCVNMPYQTTVGVNMQWVYNWTPLGTPIIIY